MPALELKPYQRRAVDFIVDTPKCALWWEMGLGKTATVLTALKQLLWVGEVNKVLIVAPKRVCTDVWPAEMEKWDLFDGLSYTALTGSPAWRRNAYAHAVENYDISLINYEMLGWWIDYAGRDWPWDMVVFDESSRMKNPQAKRVRAMRKAMKHVDRCVQLTGTPTPNGLMDLWAPVYLLDRGERLGKTLTAFRRRWFEQVGAREWNQYKPLPHAQREIEDRCKDICTSLQSDDYLELPDRIDNVVRVTLPDQHMKDYRCLESQMYVELENASVEAFNAAAATNKCLQFANGAVYHDDDEYAVVHDAKLEALDGIVEEACGQPIVVAYWYKFDLERLKTRYPHGVALAEEPTAVEKWNAGQLPLLFLHPASGGHGLNLQAGGNVLVWFGPIWNLELYQQTNARLHRQGQEKPVYVHHIVADGTLDDTVMVRVDSKASVQELLMQRMKRLEAA